MAQGPLPPSPEQIPAKVKRALLDWHCHDSFEMFCRAAWPILHPNAPFPTTIYLLAMIHEVEQLVKGELRRLVVNVPPRHGKSEFATCMLAAWILGRDPASKVFVVSYGLQLSEALTGKVRNIVTHPSYKRIFPRTRVRVGANRVGHFMTTAGGECMAASQDSAITGFGTHYMLVDDFQKADEALSPLEREKAISTFRNTLLSRFDNLGDGRILINQQRLHEYDISGWAIALGWRQFKLPAIAIEDQKYALPRGGIWHRKKGDLLDPVRVPKFYLDEQRLAQGARHYEAQYQQNVGVSEGCLIELGWFGQYDEVPRRSELLKVVQSVDPAITDHITSDWSVGMTWGYNGEEWMLVDLFRLQIRFGGLLDRICASHKKWRADVLIIEGASIGHGLYDKVKERNVPGIILVPTPTWSKLDRVASCTVQLETGNFLLPTKAPWLDDLRRELVAFPDGRNDDQVDALTQFLEFIFPRKRWADTYRDPDGRWTSPPRERRPRDYDE